MDGRPTVQVTAKFGWPAVPDDVTKACLVQAGQLHKAKDTPFGVAGVSDMGVLRSPFRAPPDREGSAGPLSEAGRRVSIATMRSGLADAIGGISGLRCGEYVADIANVPAASVNLKKAAYDFVFENGKATYTFSVMVYFDRNNERAAQVFFDALMEPTGATSVKATVETDTTWGRRWVSTSST
jgi:hypothetical protein